MTRPRGALNKTPEERELEKERRKIARQNRAALRRKLPTKKEQLVLDVLRAHPHLTMPQLQTALAGTIDSKDYLKALMLGLRRKGLIKAQSQLTIYWAT